MSTSLASTPNLGSSSVYPLRLLIAIIIFSAIAPGILMTAPAVSDQLVRQWQLGPVQIGNLFSIELGAMSLATLPAWWWISRINWRRVALLSVLVFIAGNVASALANDFTLLLWLRFVTSLAGGTLMILCITCAAGCANPSRVYAFWVLGQLLFGALGLLLLPLLFDRFGLMAVYLLLAGSMLLCVPLVSAFPSGLTASRNATNDRPSTSSLPQKLCAVLAILTFYISLSSVWTFIGRIAENAGLSPTLSGQILAVATVLGIVGAIAAAMIGTRFNAMRLIWLGYILLLASVALLINEPLLQRFTLAALLFKFTWTFVLPFLLERVAKLDNDGKLMNGINLVIGGGMAIGPALAGYLIESFGGLNSMLISAFGCSLLSLLFISWASSRASHHIKKEEK